MVRERAAVTHSNQAGASEHIRHTHTSSYVIVRRAYRGRERKGEERRAQERGKHRNVRTRLNVDTAMSWMRPRVFSNP